MTTCFLSVRNIQGEVLVLILKGRNMRDVLRSDKREQVALEPAFLEI